MMELREEVRILTWKVDAQEHMRQGSKCGGSPAGRLVHVTPFSPAPTWRANYLHHPRTEASVWPKHSEGVCSFGLSLAPFSFMCNSPVVKVTTTYATDIQLISN